MGFGHYTHFFHLKDQLKLNTDLPSKGGVRLVFDSLEGPPRTEQARRKWPSEEQLYLPLAEEHRRRKVPVPSAVPATAKPSHGGQALRLRSSANALLTGDCRKSDLWLPLFIPIRGHVDLPGISDRAVYAAFSATFWSSALFFLSFCCRRPQPSTPARA